MKECFCYIISWDKIASCHNCRQHQDLIAEWRGLRDPTISWDKLILFLYVVFPSSIVQIDFFAFCAMSLCHPNVNNDCLPIWEVGYPLPLNSSWRVSSFVSLLLIGSWVPSCTWEEGRHWSDRSVTSARVFQGQGRARFVSRGPRRGCLKLPDVSEQLVCIPGISRHCLVNEIIKIINFFIYAGHVGCEYGLDYVNKRIPILPSSSFIYLKLRKKITFPSEMLWKNLPFRPNFNLSDWQTSFF